MKSDIEDFFNNRSNTGKLSSVSSLMFIHAHDLIWMKLCNTDKYTLGDIFVTLFLVCFSGLM